MRLLRLSLLALVALGLCACSNSESAFPTESVSVSVKADTLEGMMLVKSAGAITVLGTLDENARVNERPLMAARFGYSFSIARHEATCGEFNRLMREATGLELDCKNEELPATDVSYYDAVLFANERSKAEKFDTAYTYVKAVFDDARHCTNLEGFAFHPEVNAYRLPTEAEWILVASQDWDISKGWTAANSDYKLHKVCGKANSDEICDMVGNAMEWVNDWLGNFFNIQVDNYIGAPDGGSLGQRVVKGGSFRTDTSTITLYSRGDVYAVTSSTRAEYVGFRLAFGNIPDATWLSSDGAARTSRVVPLANSSTMRSLTGTYKVKLAFRNDISGNLAYVDYSGGALSVTEIEDDIEVYHPEISPDGKRVAFCTGLEGVSGKSALYVRDLNASGSNLVKLNVESAAIPRWRVLASGDTAIVYVTDAGSNKDESAFKGTSTWQVVFAGGKFGTPKKLFDGAYHGGISEDESLAVTGARLLRARVAKSGSSVMKNAQDVVWLDGEQACNASLAKDSSKRTLFLDFGSKVGHKFVGDDYGVHERLLVVDSAGKLIQSVASPSGYSFDHSEWATGGANLAVATLTNSNGSHQKIVLVNLSDSVVVDLAEGDELWHPNLWMGSSISQAAYSLDLDSAGIYFESMSDPVLSQKMNLFWTMSDSLKVVALGSSRMSQGFASPMITYGLTLNMANIPSDMDVSLYLAQNYVLNHCTQLEYLIVGLDFDLWHDADGVNLGQNTLSFPGYAYDRNHGFWVDEGAAEMKSLSAQMVQDNFYFLVMRDVLGWVIVDEGYSWENTGFNPDPVVGDSCWSDHVDTHVNAMKKFEKIVEMAANRNVTVIGLIFPQSPYYKTTGSYGRHGMRRSTAMKLQEQLKEMCLRHPNLVIMDENKMGDHDYPDDMAFDYDHLNSNGANRLAARVDSVMISLKKK